MAKREQYWVAKMEMTLGGKKVTRGQLVQPCGSRNDHVIFGDNTRWAYRYDGTDPLTCGTDGCTAMFDNLGSLERHRAIVHAPERDERQRAQIEAAKAAKRAEERGDAIGGHEVIEHKRGPGGAVPYIAPLGT